MSGLEFMALIGFAALIFVLYAIKENRLEDPDRSDTIHIAEMRVQTRVRPGPVSATLTRQSGNLYRELGVFNTLDEAFNEVEKSFRRAKIESVYVQKNSVSEFRVMRLHHSHGGKSEGKKLGGAVLFAA